MASKVQICNLALIKIGESIITSLTDNTERAKACNIIFDDMADEVMSEGPWTSAVARAKLNQLSDTPNHGFSYQYQLPTDPYCLKVLRIDEDLDGLYEYKIEGSKLLTDLTSVNIEYIGRIEDTEQYDVDLKKAIISRLAAELSYRFTGSASVTEKLIQEYKENLANGLSNNNQQGSIDIVNNDTYTDVR